MNRNIIATFLKITFACREVKKVWLKTKHLHFFKVSLKRAVKQLITLTMVRTKVDADIVLLNEINYKGSRKIKMKNYLTFNNKSRHWSVDPTKPLQTNLQTCNYSFF